MMEWRMRLLWVTRFFLQKDLTLEISDLVSLTPMIDFLISMRGILIFDFINVELMMNEC